MNFREFLEEKFTGDITKIKIEKIAPEKKDFDRVEKLRSTQEAKMANAITDPIKLVRRTKAYIAKNGNVPNPFINKMIEMGFTENQVKDITTAELPRELPEPVQRKNIPSRRAGSTSKYDDRSPIMNASSVYKGKLSKVIKDLDYGKSVILLGLANEKRKVAVIGEASGMDIKTNGLDYYGIGKSGQLQYKIDTGNGYREPRTEIIITDYVLVDNGEALTKYKDQSYSYYVFK